MIGYKIVLKEYTLYIGRFQEFFCPIVIGRSFDGIYEMAEEVLMLILYCLKWKRGGLPRPMPLKTSVLKQKLKDMAPLQFRVHPLQSA